MAKKRSLIAVWRGIKWCFRWCVGVPIFFVGLGGLSDDIETWASWLDLLEERVDSIMTDPQILALAEHAVWVAEFINQAWVRIIFVLLGVVLIFWRWRPFWRLRHRFWFWGKRLVSEQVWISEEAALKLMKESPWARGLVPQPTGFGAAFARSLASMEENPHDVKMRRLHHYLRLTLNHFALNNPNAVRGDKEREYEEGRLRLFLDMVLEEVLTKEFGEIPDFSVPED